MSLPDIKFALGFVCLSVSLVSLSMYDPIIKMIKQENTALSSVDP